MNAAPLCKCGQPRPKRPSQDIYRPRCDECEARMVAARKREQSVRYRQRVSLRSMTKAQQP